MDISYATQVITRNSAARKAELAILQKEIATHLSAGHNVPSSTLARLLELQVAVQAWFAPVKIVEAGQDLEKTLAEWAEYATEEVMGGLSRSTSGIRNEEYDMEREARITVLRTVTSLLK